MQFAAARDSFGRIVCTVEAGGRSVVVTCGSADAAGESLLAAIDDTRRDGCGECVWPEAIGEYRWMFRRTGEIVTLVALWSTGTLTGWQMLLEAQTEFEPFAQMVQRELASLG